MTSPYVFPGLKTVFVPKGNLSQTLELIINVACEVWEVEPEELRGDSRIKNVTHARSFVMWLLTKKTDMSLKAIGARFGRHHSTVINARHVVEDALDGYDVRYRKEIDEALKRLKGH